MHPQHIYLLRPFLKPGDPVTIWYEKQLQKR